MKLVSLTLLVIFLVISNSQLLLDRHFQESNENFAGNIREKNYKLNIDQTTCNEVDITPILPPGQKTSNFVVRSGYLTVDHKEGSGFGFIFWGAMAANGDATKLKDYPTLIWLQGGPGGSSQFGDFTEMGPIIVDGMNGKFTYKYNHHSWNQQYNMIFIDNPLGTGLSYATSRSAIPTNQQQVSFDFYEGLESLYENENGCFNQLNLKESPLFITGESYAGKYVPAIAAYILTKPSSSIIKQALLKGGIAVGDGFTDPKVIMDSLGDFGYNVAMVNKKQRDTILKQSQAGDSYLAQGKTVRAKSYFDIIMNELANWSGLHNPYNWADVQNAPATFNLGQWMNSEAIKNGVFQFPKDLKYSQHSEAVYSALKSDFMKSNVVYNVEYLLQKDFPVMYYNGQNDVIVCTPCTTNWLDKVSYQGSEEFYKGSYSVWNTTVSEQTKVGGYFKQSENLIFATVNQAGHMVPTDQPEAASTLITSFVDFALNYQKGLKEKIFTQESLEKQQEIRSE